MEKCNVVSKFDVCSSRGDIINVGASLGKCVNATVNIVPPVFGDYAGRSWESQYPCMVDKYYRLVEAVIGSGLRGERETTDCNFAYAGVDRSVGPDTGSVEAVSVGDAIAAIVSSGGTSRGGENRFLLDKIAVESVGESHTSDTGIDRVSVDKSRSVPGAFGRQVNDFHVRGKNFERNCFNRSKKKDRKLKRKAMQGKNWREGNVQFTVASVPALDSGNSLPAKDSGTNGFWNSCSEDMRRQLIDSKARMHVASNNKKAEEDERRVKQLQSPEQLLRDAMRLVNFANEQAKAKNDSKVCGWAKTVAESYAETIAKSAPTSVESFESFVQSNSSITSVSIEAFNEIVKIKDEQLKVLDTQSKTLDTQSRTLDELNKRIAELEVIASSRGNITVKCGVLGKCGDKKPIGNVATGVSNVKIVQRNTQVAGTIVANKPERIMSQEHFLKFGKQPGVFFDGKDVFC